MEKLILLFKIQHFWSKDFGDVVIPFECIRCGKCCEKLGAGWSLQEIQEVSEYLEVNTISFLKKYLGGRNSGDGLDYQRKISPCPFLTKEKTCKIYPARPLACKLYPIKTAMGVGGIDCPALKSMNLTIKKLGQIGSYTTTNHSIKIDSEREKDDLIDFIWNLPDQKSWSKIKDTYAEIEHRKNVRKTFLDLNLRIRENPERIDNPKYSSIKQKKNLASISK